VTPPVNGSTTSTLTVTLAANATPGGPYTVTINGNGGVHSTTVSLTLTQATGFSISVPSPLTVSRGASGSVVVSVSGSGSVALSVSGLPSKVTAGFSPNPVTAGASSALTITVQKGARPGAYPLVVTGKVGSVSKTANLSLTIN